ncbi:Der GTPase-activating protein YihI [Vibrio cortegadensis]|uniref:Der GTPase-activating protein YihI n=1 Tax=Vibrio cortegadensis TaxID=1328770 RepID=UPI0021C37A79|nr:Der GTPase-activating protein YihI [Vibrio cortegadensis]MDN3697619.1 Der GTPase-activating protein YihI [Vibrio cortegadensis]
MSRNKKSRKVGPSSGGEVVVTRNRTESNVQGREQKRIKKRKGLKTGNRNSEVSDAKAQSAAKARDPRLGSKKKIPLIIEPKKKLTKQERKISAAQELEMLENDAQLNVLIDRIEMGENLGAGLQKYVDEKLDRIEVLMNQLGLMEPESDESDEHFGEEFSDEEMSEAELAELDAIEPKSQPKKSSSDEDLLSQFEDINLNDFKG